MDEWDVRIDASLDLDLSNELHNMLAIGAPDLEVSTVHKAGITATVQADTAVDAAMEILTFVREAYLATGIRPQWPSIAIYAGRPA